MSEPAAVGLFLAILAGVMSLGAAAGLALACLISVLRERRR